MIAGAVIDVDSMDMDANDEQAVQCSAVSASQLVSDSQEAVKKKSGRKQRTDRGSKGQRVPAFENSECGNQRVVVKRSKIQS